MKHLLMQPATSSLIRPDILLTNTLSLCSRLNIRDHVFHPYKPKGKIIVLFILSLTFLDS
jgi:hypothetical protein